MRAIARRLYHVDRQYSDAPAVRARTHLAEAGLADLVDAMSGGRSRRPLKDAAGLKSCLSFPRTLLYQVAINVKPLPALMNETTALVLANRGGIADSRTRDELHFGRCNACNARINNIQT